MVELGCDAHVRKQHRASGRLRRVRGQHQPDGYVARPALELVRRHVLQQLERTGERVSRGATRMRILASASDAVVLLGDVRELEVEGECAEDERLLLRRDRPHRLANVADDPALPGRPRE